MRRSRTPRRRYDHRDGESESCGCSEGPRGEGGTCEEGGTDDSEACCEEGRSGSGREACRGEGCYAGRACTRGTREASGQTEGHETQAGEGLETG